MRSGASFIRFELLCRCSRPPRVFNRARRDLIGSTADILTLLLFFACQTADWLTFWRTTLKG
jgi:hypothetical protein